MSPGPTAMTVTLRTTTWAWMRCRRGKPSTPGLALVREAYAAGHTAPVKAMQKKWGVTKFYDIPPEKGHEFYREAVQLVVQAGLRP